MAKIKFSLDPNPTFKANVQIPVAGAGFTPVEFIFKHRNRQAFADLVEKLAEFEPVALVMELASGWELEDPFDAAHINKLLDNYPGSFQGILDTYINELTKSSHRLGN